MKKGATEQTFIFIFALIVAAMILAWGAKTILDLRNKAEQVQIGDAIEDIKEMAITYYNLEEGSSSPIEERFPNEVKCICFKNVFNPRETNVRNGVLIDGNNLDECDDNRLEAMLDSSALEYNIFITPFHKYAVTRFSAIKQVVPYFNGDEVRYVCFKNNKGKIDAIIESKGDRVYIKGA